LNFFLAVFAFAGFTFLAGFEPAFAAFLEALPFFLATFFALTGASASAFSAAALSVAKTDVVAGAQPAQASRRLQLPRSWVTPVRALARRNLRRLNAAHAMRLAFAHLCKETKTNMIYFISTPI
jgi:hypothetical protein